MRFTIYTADCTGNERNAIYPNKAVITSSRELGTAAAFDHVCAAYKDNYRSRDNFLASDVAVMDCDNDHTENPKEWVTGEKLLAMLPNVAVAIVPSRNSGKAKEGRKARPRFHAYFPITEVQDEKAYTALKQGIREEFPFFDAQALDAARFLYGTEVVPEAILWQEGKQTITDFLAGLGPLEPDQTEPPFYTGSSIPEGNRNNTMSHFAGRVLKRYGDTDKAYENGNTQKEASASRSAYDGNKNGESSGVPDSYKHSDTRTGESNDSAGMQNHGDTQSQRSYSADAGNSSDGMPSKGHDTHLNNDAAVPPNAYQHNSNHNETAEGMSSSENVAATSDKSESKASSQDNEVSGNLASRNGDSAQIPNSAGGKDTNSGAEKASGNNLNNSGSTNESKNNGLQQ